MSWKNYFLTPDEIWPSDIVLSASYTIQYNQYICNAHVLINPSFNFSELTGLLHDPYHYIYREESISNPVFDGLSFGFSTEETTHSYKSGSGSVDSSTIQWVSSYWLINTRKYSFISGAQSDYKSFVKSDGSKGSIGGSFDNTTYYDILFNTYRPSWNWFKIISNEKGSLSTTIQGTKPSWMDPDPDPPPSDPPDSPDTYPVHLMKVSDDSSDPFILSDSEVTGTIATSKGYAYDSGKVYVIY